MLYDFSNDLDLFLFFFFLPFDNLFFDGTVAVAILPSCRVRRFEAFDRDEEAN